MFLFGVTASSFILIYLPETNRTIKNNLTHPVNIFGIIIPNATAEGFSSINNSIGTAGAIYGFFQILVTILTTYSITNIQPQTQWSLGYTFLGLGVISLAINFFTYNRS